MPPVPAGTLVYFLPANPGQPGQGLAVEGILVEDKGARLVIGVPGETSLSQASELHQLQGGISVAFISVQSAYVTAVRPVGWSARRHAFPRDKLPETGRLAPSVLPLRARSLRG